jgi:protein-S-isoprenylcysteine O-methyltransferase Ste14
VARRWAVTARRAVPLLVCLGVIGAALAVPALNLPPDSVLRMLIFNAPPLLLGLFVVLREMPRVELPPRPRRPTAAHWRSAPLPEPR